MSDERERPRRDALDALRAALLDAERAVPPGGLGRLFRTGRGAAGAALATMASRRDPDAPLDARDLERVARLVGELGELKGVAMKAGQILAFIDPSLPPELRDRLSLLHTVSPALPFAAVEAVVRRSLGERAEGLLARMERRPIAVASIGQVHRSATDDGAELAVKVRHEGVEEALRADFRAAGAGAGFVRLFAPGAVRSVRGFIDEAREAILGECDYAREASHQAAFASLFAGDPVVRIPGVVPDLCAREVLTTRYLPGRSLDAFLEAGPSQASRDLLGQALFAFYVATLYRHGLFHADPHPGNYGFRDDGTLVVYDFGCVRAFDRPTVRALARLSHAVRADDRAALLGALDALGARVPASGPALETARRLLRGFFGPMLGRGPRLVDPGASLDAREVLRDKLALASLELPGSLLFLFRLRFGLYAVLARVGARADWSALESGWADEALTA